MNHSDHVNLLRAGVPPQSGLPPVWADLGSGTGAFTLALADLLGPRAQIYSVDQDAQALKVQERELHARFPDTVLHIRNADFTLPLDLPSLDGIVSANALHFVRPQRRVEILRALKQLLAPGGHLIVVEYNADSGNPWVPYPFSYAIWVQMAASAGFSHTEQLARIPSRFLREIYSALSR